MAKELRKEGQQIFADEKLVATLNEAGGLDFEPGMAGPYKAKVIEFLNGEPESGPELPQAGQTGPTSPTGQTADAADELPPFKRSEGVKTPGFQDWVKARNLSNEQIAAIIRRCERV